MDRSDARHSLHSDQIALLINNCRGNPVLPVELIPAFLQDILKSSVIACGRDEQFDRLANRRPSRFWRVAGA